VIKNPTLSFLVPSRERANALKFSLDSLGLKRNNIEALVWVDDDDPQLKEYRKIFNKNDHIKLFIKPRVGYLNFFVMMNFLAREASGNWLLLWNDDAYMDNPDWFRIFEDFVKKFKPATEPVVIDIWSQGVIVNNLFPIVSRAYIDILGHFALTPNCDDWVRIVARGGNISHDLLGIKPKHHKYSGENILKDKIYYEVERDRAEHKKVWNEKRRLFPPQLDEDIKKILKHKK